MTLQKTVIFKKNKNKIKAHITEKEKTQLKMTLRQ